MMANHVVNEHYVFRVMFKMFSSFVSKEMKERMILCGTNYAKLQDTLDKECIPTQFGGEWEVDDNQFTDELIAKINDEVKAYWEKYPVIDKPKDKK